MSDLTCYCCEEPAVGQGDHVPAKKIFEKNAFARKRPIIVPSCRLHNEAFSEADEYLKFVMTSTADNVPPDVLQGTVRGLTRLIVMESSTIGRYGLQREGPGIVLHWTAPIDFDLLNQALTKIARGLYFHHSKGRRKLRGKVTVCPLFLGIDPNASAKERGHILHLMHLTRLDMQECEMIEVSENIFSYQVIETEEIIVINMRFYMDRIVSVMATASASG